MGKVVRMGALVVVRKIVQTRLRRCGITCIRYQDGIEALRAFKNGEDYMPDLICLDIGLPKLDGYDLLRLLKTNLQFQHTTVIMLSGRDGMLDRLKSRLAGAKGYITKPFKTQELLSVALSYLEQLSNVSPLSTGSSADRSIVKKSALA